MACVSGRNGFGHQQNRVGEIRPKRDSTWNMSLSGAGRSNASLAWVIASEIFSMRPERPGLTAGAAYQAPAVSMQHGVHHRDGQGSLDGVFELRSQERHLNHAPLFGLLKEEGQDGRLLFQDHTCPVP